MTGIRLAIGVTDGTASELVELGTRADQFGLDAIWVAPDQTPASWTLATLGTIAIATRDIRLGGVITLGADRSELLRVAEDLGVIDQASGGRLEIALMRPDRLDHEQLAASWAEMFAGWTGWRTAGGDVVAITPRPAQPWFPRLVIDDERLAEAIGGGVAITTEAGTDRVGSPRRRVLMRTADRVPTSRATSGTADAVTELRTELAATQADELVLTGRLSEFAGDRLRFLAVIVAPALRSAVADQQYVLDAALRWFGEHPDYYATGLRHA